MNQDEFRLDDALNDDLLDELASTGPEKDILVALLLDTSGSMASVTTDGAGNTRPRIEGAQAGLDSLLAHCRSVPFYKRSVWLGVGRFGQNVGFDAFQRVDDIAASNLSAGGGTPLGPALNLALDATQELVCRLDDEERRFSIPNLCIVSDGAPNPCPELKAATKRAAQLVKGGDLSISLVGIDQADCDRLKALGLSGKSYCVADLSWEDIIKQTTLGGGGTASQHDAA